MLLIKNFFSNQRMFFPLYPWGLENWYFIQGKTWKIKPYWTNHQALSEKIQLTWNFLGPSSKEIQSVSFDIICLVFSTAIEKQLSLICDVNIPHILNVPNIHHCICDHVHIMSNILAFAEILSILLKLCFFTNSSNLRKHQWILCCSRCNSTK